MPEPCLLVGDLGGTNARFALADSTNPGYSQELTLKCAEFDSVSLAIGHYLEQFDGQSPDVICLAVAGPVVDQRVQMTNGPWSVDADDLRTTYSLNAVQLFERFRGDSLVDSLLGDTGRRRITPSASSGLAPGLGAARMLKQGKKLTTTKTEGRATLGLRRSRICSWKSGRS